MKKILVVCGDYHHSREVVELGFKELQLENVDIQFVKDVNNILTPAFLDEFELIINCKGNCATASEKAFVFTSKNTEVRVKELEEYVAKGKSFLALHAGVSFREAESKEYTDFVGCAFIKHPPRSKVRVEDIALEHPIMNGIESFEFRDEHYEIELCGDCEDILFKTTSEEGGTQVGGYTKTLGKGRICALVPGHILDVWKNKQYQKIIKNAIDWCTE